MLVIQSKCQKHCKFENLSESLFEKEKKQTRKQGNSYCPRIP